MRITAPWVRCAFLVLLLPIDFTLAGESSLAAAQPLLGDITVANVRGLMDAGLPQLAAASIRDSLPRNPVNIAAITPLDDAAFDEMLSDAWYLYKHRLLKVEDLEKVGRLQLDATQRLVKNVKPDDAVYRRWCKYRLNQIRWRAEVRRWDASQRFIDSARKEGLTLNEDATREQFYLLLLHAHHLRYMNSGEEAENRHWLGDALKKTQDPAEKDRLNALLKGDDPVAREQEASRIRREAGGHDHPAVNWGAPDALFGQAEGLLTQLFQIAQDPESKARVVADVLSYAAKVEGDARLRSALAFRERMETPDQVALTAVISLNYSIRGDPVASARLLSEISLQLRALDGSPGVDKAQTAAAEAMKAAVSTFAATGNSKDALNVAKQIFEAIGANAPEYVIAAAQAAMMQPLSWNGQQVEALALADQMLKEFGGSSNPSTRRSVIDALCHAYAFSAVYLHDPVRADSYLTVIRQRFPEPFTEQQLAIYQKLVTARLAVRVPGS